MLVIFNLLTVFHT